MALNVQSCTFWNLVAYGGGGAAIGWLMGGVLVDTQDESVRRRRRQLTFIGALIGTFFGVAEAVRRECITSRGH